MHIIIDKKDSSLWIQTLNQNQKVKDQVDKNYHGLSTLWIQGMGPEFLNVISSWQC